NIVEEWVSNKEPHIIRGLLVDEEYILHEDLAPIGYATASDVTFTVNGDGSTTKVVMKDEITKVDISKVDATTSKEIEGAKLTLTDKETGQVIETWTSKKEPHRIEGLEVNKTYILHEDLAPAGYETASDVEFTIKDTGEVQKVVMKDEHKSVTVKTGDSYQAGLYIVMTAVAGLGIVTALKLRKKKEYEDE
ncbi:MAG: collagen binding domain-containing protein, partial [Faecalibacillus sp.]